MEAKQHLVSYFTVTVKNSNAKPSRNYDIETLIKEGISTNFERLLKQVQSLEYQSKAYKEAKLSLPYFTPHGTFAVRQNEHLQKLSGLMLQDLDLQDNKDLNPEEFIETLKKDAFVYAIFKSPSGGIKFLVKSEIPNNETQNFKKYHNTQSKYFEKKYSIKLDYSQGTLSQPCFISYDPDAYINTFSDNFVFTPLDFFEKENKTKNGFHIAEHSDNVFSLCERLIQEKQNLNFVEGQRHDYIRFLAYYLNNFGVAESDAENYINSNYIHFSQNPSNAISFAYSHNQANFGKWQFKTKQEFFEEKRKDKERSIKEKVKQVIEPQKTNDSEDALYNFFPEKLRNALSVIAEVKSFPKNLLFFSALNAFASQIGLTHKIRIECKGWEQYGSLYSALVGDSSIGKSPTMNFTIKPIKEMQKMFAQEYKESKQEFLEAKKDKNKTTPEEPVLKKVIMNDSTIEALSIAHQNNQKGLLLHVDELAGWVQNLSKYSKSSSESKQYLSIWSNEYISQDRVSRESIYLDRTFVNIFGGIQPQILQSLAKSGLDVDGFLYRFLFVFASEVEPKLIEKIRFCDIEEKQYTEALFKVINLDFSEGTKTIELKHNTEAGKLFAKWLFEKEKLLQEGRASGDSAKNSIISKMMIYVSRFALIQEIIKYSVGLSQKLEISLDSLEKAIQLGEYFTNNSFQALDIIETNKSEESDNNNYSGQKVNWVQIFEGNTEMETKELEAKVVAIKGCSFRTARRYVKNELRKVRHGIWTYL